MGLGSFIQTQLIQIVKKSVKFNLSIDPLLKKFSLSCPSKELLINIINQTNSLNSSLSQLLSTLKTVSGTIKPIDDSLKVASTAINVLKILPIPTSVPPGVGIPLGNINTLTTIINSLSKLINEGEGVLTESNNAVVLIQNIIGGIQFKIQTLDSLIIKCLNQLNLPQSETDSLIASISTTNISSDSNINDLNEQALIASLQANSTNPYTYEGWTFTIDSNNLNIYSFPQRRIIAKKLISVLHGEYSYTATTEILVNEMKFRIDNGGLSPQYYSSDPLQNNNIIVTNIDLNSPITNDIVSNSSPITNDIVSNSKSITKIISNLKTVNNNQNLYPPFGEKGTTIGQIKFHNKKPFRWTGIGWVDIAHDLLPFGFPGTFDKEIKKFNFLKYQWIAPNYSGDKRLYWYLINQYFPFTFPGTSNQEKRNYIDPYTLESILYLWDSETKIWIKN